MVRIASEVDPQGRHVKRDSEFAHVIRDFILENRPLKLLETGTDVGMGTTYVIAQALRDASLEDATFFSIEVNPTLFWEAKKNLEREGLLKYVHLINGLSLPRYLLPSLEEIHREFVLELKGDIIVDYEPEIRAQKYFEETHFPQVPDDCLGWCLQQFNYNPDFVLLDSAGYLGFTEFTYLLENLEGECVIALDDINHVKHHRSFEYIASHKKLFNILKVSNEKFGFCLVRYRGTGFGR